MESEQNCDISKELNKVDYKEDVLLLEKAKEKMVAMELFDKKFIDGLNFTFVDITVKDGRNEEVEYRLGENGSFIPYNNENSDRSREVGMITTSYLDKVDQLFDSKSKVNKGQQVWLGKLDKSIFLSFDAAAVHEIAHAKSYNVIDKERKSLFDEEKFRKLITETIENDPVLSKEGNVDLSKFNYSDTNWSELYALLYHREFLRNDNSDNDEMIKEWDKHIIEVASDLPGAIEKLNQEKNIDIDPEVIYKDGHAFSYLLARVFEKKYTDFNERIKVLEQCKHDNNDSEELPTEQKEINLAQQKWDKASERTEKIEDDLGCSVDENIKETVTAFNVFEINTSGSCEGHIDQGCGVPWIEVAAPNKPEEEYINEKSVIERIASENNISVDDLRKEEKYEAILQQAKNEFEKNGKTEKAIAWQEENEKLKAVMEDVVFDFYQNRDVSEDVRLKFRSIGDFGRFRILSGTHEDYERDFETMSGAEKEELGTRLEKYRKEMNDFTDFLKGKLFDEGEIYINNKKNKAQEKIDKEKIGKIRKSIENSDVKGTEVARLSDFDEEYFHSISAGDKYDWIAIGMENCKNQKYYTAVGKDNVKLGIVGIYDTDDEQNITHIIIDPKFRGKGLLSKFYDQLLEKENLTSLTAIVNIDNKASINSHEKAGFEKVSDEDYEKQFHKYKYTYVKK